MHDVAYIKHTIYLASIYLFFLTRVATYLACSVKYLLTNDFVWSYKLFKFIIAKF